MTSCIDCPDCDGTGEIAESAVEGDVFCCGGDSPICPPCQAEPPVR